MASKTIIVNKVGSEVWQKFAGHCKAKGVFVGEELTDILSFYLKENKEV